jgi:GNAT superfamily N-acetyltransferase
MTVLRWIASDDPFMVQVNDLRHEVLFAPFGVRRDDGWDDEGTDRMHLVALDGDRVVGYACLLLEAASGHCRQVSVRPELQGAGIGREMMVEIEREARRRDYGLLWLNARTHASGFYERLGYEVVSGEFPSGRTGLPHVRMERRLGPL